MTREPELSAQLSKLKERVEALEKQIERFEELTKQRLERLEKRRYVPQTLKG